MIEIRATTRADNTTVVELEAFSGSSNGNSNRTKIGSLHKLILIPGLGSNMGIDASNRLARLLATSHLANIGVVRVLADTTSTAYILPCPVHETAAAALVTVRASTIEELLVGKWLKLAILKRPVAFKCTCNGVGPARATLTLIHDRSHSILLAPVDGIRSSDVDELGQLRIVLWAAGLRVVEETAVLLQVLVLPEVTELVEADIVGVVGVLVVLANEVNILLEDTKAVLEIFLSVGPVVLLRPLTEHVLELHKRERER